MFSSLFLFSRAICTFSPPHDSLRGEKYSKTRPLDLSNYKKLNDISVCLFLLVSPPCDGYASCDFYRTTQDVEEHCRMETITRLLLWTRTIRQCWLIMTRIRADHPQLRWVNEWKDDSRQMEGHTSGSSFLPSLIRSHLACLPGLGYCGRCWAGGSVGELMNDVLSILSNVAAVVVIITIIISGILLWTACIL